MDSNMKTIHLPKLNDHLYLQYKFVRMMHQYFLAPIGILNYDGWKRYLALLNSLGDKITLSELHEINAIVTTDYLNDSNDIINYVNEKNLAHILKWFYPKVVYDLVNDDDNSTPEDDSKIISDHKIMDSIWLIPPHRLPNFFNTLRDYFKVNVAIARIALLRELYQFSFNNDSFKNPKVIDIGFGLHSVIQNVEIVNDGKPSEKCVLFFGSTFFYSDLDDFNTDLSQRYLKFKLEKHIAPQIKAAHDLYCKCLKQPKESYMSFERNTHILSQLSKSIMTGIETFLSKASICFSVYEHFNILVNSLIFDHFGLNRLRGAEWRKILKDILYVNILTSTSSNQLCDVCYKERSISISSLKSEKNKLILGLKAAKDSVDRKTDRSNLILNSFSNVNEIKKSIISDIDDISSQVTNIEVASDSCCSTQNKIFQFSLYPNSGNSLQAEIPYCLPVFRKDNHGFKVTFTLIKKDVEEPFEIVLPDNCIFSKEIKKSYRKRYFRFNDEYNSNEYCTDWQFLDRVRHVMQRMSHTKISRFLKYGASCAMDIAEAHNAFIILYDSLNDYVDCNNAHIKLLLNRWLYNNDNDVDIEFTVQMCREKITKEFIRIKRTAQSDLLIAKEESTILRSLRPDIISRFSTCNNANNSWISSPFAEKIDDNIKRLSSIEIEGSSDNRKDIISVPLMFHGRRQGVLHLNSEYQNQFTYENRMSIISFKRLFEEELFELRQNIFIDDMNSELGAILATDQNESAFFNKLTEKLAQLFGAHGAIICFQNEENKFRVLGTAGQEISMAFANNDIDVDSSIVKAIHKEKPTLYSICDLAIESDYYYSILEKMKIKEIIISPFVPKQFNGKENDYVGFFLLLDVSLSNHISNALIQELKFIADEIFQTIKHYNEHRVKIDKFQSLYAHDILVHLSGIENYTLSLQRFAQDIVDPTRKIAFLKNISDLGRYKDTTRALFQFIRRRVSFADIDPISRNMLAAYTEFLDKGIINNIDLYEIIMSNALSKVKSNLNLLSCFDFNFAGLKGFKVSISQTKLDEVFGNLIDNICKYALLDKRVLIEYKNDYPFGINIIFSNYSLPLKGELKDNSTALFSFGVRGRGDDGSDGQGYGAYLAKEMAKSWGGTIKFSYRRFSSNEALYTFSVFIPEYKLIRKKEVANENQ